MFAATKHRPGRDDESKHEFFVGEECHHALKSIMSRQVIFLQFETNKY
jgi:hypothetical protein